MYLKPNVPYTDMPPYTMMVASSIVKAISRLTGIDTEIKWVNDIYLGNHKVAGILTEAITSVETGLITDVIIGVGLNFLSPTSQKRLLKRQVLSLPKNRLSRAMTLSLTSGNYSYLFLSRTMSKFTKKNHLFLINK